jgi:hypothetical protein
MLSSNPPVVPLNNRWTTRPFPADELRDPEDARLNKKLKTFEAWFEKKRPSLEQQGRLKNPTLQSLTKELSTNLE